MIVRSHVRLPTRMHQDDMSIFLLKDDDGVFLFTNTLRGSHQRLRFRRTFRCGVSPLSFWFSLGPLSSSASVYSLWNHGILHVADVPEPVSSVKRNGPKPWSFPWVPRQNAVSEASSRIQPPSQIGRKSLDRTRRRCSTYLGKLNSALPRVRRHRRCVHVFQSVLWVSTM